MQIPNAIKTSLDYIERNLKTDITINELADMVGYSPYHYSRLFTSIVGSSIASYILKRRLDYALAEMTDNRKGIDVVLEYGFETYAGFYKAFVKMYGCSPKKYLSIYNTHQPRKPEVLFMYTEKQLRDILSNWDIPQDLPIENIYIMNGAKVSGSSWKVGDEYILRGDSREVINKNITIAKALDRQSFQAFLPVPTKSGEEYLDGEKLFLLTQDIKGTPLNNPRGFGNEYGKSIARLHNAFKEIEADICPDESNLYHTVTGWALPNVKQQNEQWSMSIPDDFFDDYIETFGALYDALPKQLIHRNLCSTNILVYNGEVSGIIEFNEAQKNVRLFDPCYCATGILSEGSDEIYAVWIDLLKSIIHGYDSINSLSAEEKQAIYYVICSIQMICIAYFESIDDNNFKELAKINRKMLQFIIANKEEIKTIL